LQKSGDNTDAAYLLGVMSSIPFDWYARRFVELHVTFELLGPMPVPSSTEHPGWSKRLSNVSARLAAVDERYTDWAASVGVVVGSVTSDAEKIDLIAELDALVSLLYGLDRDDVVHIFETFHRGWNYAERLNAVLRHFDTWKDQA
jgi:hypothetical protein